MGRDSNPRYLAVHTLSRRARSTALAPIRNEPTSLESIEPCCKSFVPRSPSLLRLNSGKLRRAGRFKVWQFCEVAAGGSRE